MEFSKVLQLLTISVTILNAVYFWRSKLRFYFLFLALMDFLSFILWFFLPIVPQYIWVPLTYLLLFSLYEDFFKKFIIYILLGLVPVLIINHNLSTTEQHYFVMSVNIILLFLFIKEFMREFLNLNRIDLVYGGIILYQSIIVLNFIAIIRDIQFGATIYFAGMIAILLVKIWLIIIRNSKGIYIK
jgi:hypothetical protein